MKSDSLSMKIGFVLLCLIWGSTWLAIKIGLESVPPFYGILLRFLLAIVILYIIMRVRGLQIPRDKESWRFFSIVGLLSFGLPFIIIYWSGQFLPSALMSILFAVFPFVVAIFSHFFLPGEPLNTYKVFGILLGFSGILVIFSRGLTNPGEIDHFAFLGMLGVIAATLLQAASLMVVKRKGKEISPVTLNFACMLVGMVPVAVLAMIFERASDIHFDLKAVGSIVYLAICGSVVTFVIYFWLLKRVEAVYLSFLTFITPVVAVVLGALVLKETLEPNTFLGAGLVLLGILVANGKGLARFITNIRNKETVVS